MNMQPLVSYLSSRDPSSIDAALLAYVSSLCVVAETSPEIARAIVRELIDQRSNLKLIASENYSSLAVQLSMGNLLTDKYAEGFPYHRFYAGCDNVDEIESFACEAAKKLFGAEHAYVQPHSGADANLVAYWAILSQRVRVPMLKRLGQENILSLDREEWRRIRTELGSQKLLAMDYFSGGHLTHGYRHNVSAQMFDVHSYGVSRSSGLIDYDELEKQACEVRPLILLAGYSAYPRRINFRRMREIADACGAVLMVDMAHFAGLVAGGVFTGDFNPVPFAHVVTTTTHKTLRGPRGGMVLCTSEFAEAVDKGCPLILGGPLPHVMAAKGVCFVEALSAPFRKYARRRRQCADSRRKLRRRGYDGGERRHRQSSRARRRSSVRAHGASGGERAAPMRNDAQQEFSSVRSERRVVYERTPPRHARGDDARHGAG